MEPHYNESVPPTLADLFFRIEELELKWTRQGSLLEEEEQELESLEQQRDNFWPSD